jgi:LmbE family N-acetylglucosaminyl deacetylase
MTRHLRWAIAMLAVLAGCAAPDPGDRDAVDLMVFAPHPDDETLGCAGILHQALKRGERVKVVVFTSGDGYPAAAALLARKPADRLMESDFQDLARFRQLQSRAAFEALGGNPRDLIFLGYPDSALDQVYRARDAAPVRQRFTGRSETYAAAQIDYRSARSGKAARYVYDEALADVASLIADHHPRRICVTTEADRHPDHQAAFRFVRDAMDKTGHRGELDTYLIHGGPLWPWPSGATPGSPYEAHEVKGVRIPQGVAWPPSRRIALTPVEAVVKQKAIAAQASHLTPEAPASMQEERALLESFVKSEEIFWRER